MVRESAHATLPRAVKIYLNPFTASLVCASLSRWHHLARRGGRSACRCPGPYHKTAETEPPGTSGNRLVTNVWTRPSVVKPAMSLWPSEGSEAQTDGLVAPLIVQVFGPAMMWGFIREGLQTRCGQIKKYLDDISSLFFFLIFRDTSTSVYVKAVIIKVNKEMVGMWHSRC